MTDLNSILAREDSNKDKIYLYYNENKWMAYGQSACLLEKICPQTRTFDITEKNVTIVCAYIDMKTLLNISPYFPTAIGDNFIEIVTGNL